MADISDVTDALVDLITGAIYPNGALAASTVVANGAALNVRVFPGWPNPASLDADVLQGVINVSVFPQPGNERTTSRFERRWHDLPAVTPTITVTRVGRNITIGGTITAGHYVTIQAGQKVGSFAARAGDTLFGFASQLGAALTSAGVQTTTSDGVLTVPAALADRLTIRTGAPGKSVVELGRSDQRYHVTIWAPNNAARVATAKIVKPALDAVDFLSLPDEFTGWLRYESSSDVDRTGKQSVSCRDLFYWVEYPTVQEMVGYPITTFVTEIEGDNNQTHIEPLPLPSFTPEVTRIS